MTLSQHMIYDKQFGDLCFDVDGSGTASATQSIALLTSHPSLTYQNFVLVT